MALPECFCQSGESGAISLTLLPHPRKRHPRPQTHRNKTQRKPLRNVHVVREQHLYPDESEQSDQTIFQIIETLHQIRQQEIHRPQPQYRHDVGTEYQKRVRGNSQHRRDAVEREENVRKLDE